MGLLGFLANLAIHACWRTERLTLGADANDERRAHYGHPFRGHHVKLLPSSRYAPSRLWEVRGDSVRYSGVARRFNRPNAADVGARQQYAMTSLSRKSAVIFPGILGQGRGDNSAVSGPARWRPSPCSSKAAETQRGAEAVALLFALAAIWGPEPTLRATPDRRHA